MRQGFDQHVIVVELLNPNDPTAGGALQKTDFEDRIANVFRGYHFELTATALDANRDRHRASAPTNSKNLVKEKA
jgi:hypothetical protein